MANRAIEYIYKLVDQYSREAEKIASSTKKMRNEIDKAKLKAQQMGQSIKNSLKNVAMVGVGALIAGMSIAIAKGVQLASNLTEVQNVVDTTFVSDADKINKWSKNAITQFGLSELEAKKFNGTMGAMLKSSGLSGEGIVKLSTDMVGLSGDFASFYNLDAETAFLKIRSGISGETEPLKQLGINMSEVNLEAFALTQGITKKMNAFTQSEKVMLRYNYLMSVSKDAQGDFNKTLSTSFANQQRVLSTKFSQILAQGMTKLLPLLIEGGKWLNNLLDKVDADKLAVNVEKGARALIAMGKGLFEIFKALKPLIPVFIIFIALWKVHAAMMVVMAFLPGILKYIRVIMMMIKAKGLWITIQWLLNGAVAAFPIFAIILGIMLLIAAIILLVIYYKQVIAFTTLWWDRLKGLLMIFSPINTIIVITIEIIRSLAASWDIVIEKFKGGDLLGAILEIGKAILRGVIAPVESLLALIDKIPFMKGITGKAFEGLDKIKEALGLNIGEAKNNELKMNGKDKAQVNVKTDLSVYTEKGMNVTPFKKRDNLGYQMSGVH